MQRLMATLAQLTPSWPAHGIQNVRPLQGGYANDNYRFEFEGAAFVARVPRPGAPPPSGLSDGGGHAVGRRAEARYLALDAAPEVVAFDPASGALVTRWIDGAVLADAPPRPAAAGRWLATLHDAIPTGERGYDPIAAARTDLAGIDDVVPAAMAALQRPWRPRRRRGCHNDLNPWNVVRTAAGWRTLDWELAGDNDPLFDAAALAHGLGYGAAALASLLRAYTPSPPSAEAVRAAQIAFQLREYAWARRQLALGNANPDVRRQAAEAAAALAELMEGGER